MRLAFVACLAVLLGAPASAASPPSISDRPAIIAVQANLIDINSATLEQLQSLKGIGPVRAKAIVEGRPYRGKNELVSKKIIPQGVYDDIQALIVARQR